MEKTGSPVAARISGRIGHHVGAFEHDGAHLRMASQSAIAASILSCRASIDIELDLVAENDAGEFAPAFGGADGVPSGTPAFSRCPGSASTPEIVRMPARLPFGRSRLTMRDLHQRRRRDRNLHRFGQVLPETATEIRNWWLSRRRRRARDHAPPRQKRRACLRRPCARRGPAWRRAQLGRAPEMAMSAALPMSPANPRKLRVQHQDSDRSAIDRFSALHDVCHGNSRRNSLTATASRFTFARCANRKKNNQWGRSDSLGSQQRDDRRRGDGAHARSARRHPHVRLVRRHDPALL